MIYFKHFTSLQWFGFITIISFAGMILTLFANEPAPSFFIVVNGIAALFALVFIEWPSKHGYKSELSRSIMMSCKGDVSGRFNPVEGKSAEDIIHWFQKIVDVELNSQNFKLALDAINLHLSNEPLPTIKSVLDSLDNVDSLKAFASELKRNLLYVNT